MNFRLPTFIFLFVFTSLIGNAYAARGGGGERGGSHEDEQKKEEQQKKMEQERHHPNDNRNEQFHHEEEAHNLNEERNLNEESAEINTGIGAPVTVPAPQQNPDQESQNLFQQNEQQN